MKSDSIAFGVAGILFGLIAGWVIGSQQAALRQPAAAVQTAQPPAATAAILDQAQVNAFTSLAEREPSNAVPRGQLGKLYFEADLYDDSIKWYSDALRLAPNDVEISTDLGVSYYYTNQPDRALEQFDRSLKLDPKHAKTLFHVGIVKAIGKQDLQGAQQAWEQVIKLAPQSPEAQEARRALDSLRAAHPAQGAARKPGA
jgi:tetratricopeptide (TPR) repeat protein